MKGFIQMATTLMAISLIAIPAGAFAHGKDDTGVSSDNLGVFQEHGDVGPVNSPGSVVYDEQAQTYRISGSGSNIWADSDEFHFVWRKLSGNFILSADASFLGEGVDPHRKLGWMIRADLDRDSSYVDVALHGDGLTSLQYRLDKGGETREVVSAIKAPEVLQLERRNGSYIMSVARKGDRLTSTGFSDITLPDEVYVGLFISAHNSDVVESADFSNVRITIPAADDFRPYNDFIGSRLEIVEVETGLRRVIHTEEDSLQAPNWVGTDNSLIYNRNGRLYRFDLASNLAEELDTGFAILNNNDHVLSFDEQRLGISHHSEDHGGDSMIYVLPRGGGTPELITRKAPSYLHGWSPDGKWLVYTGGRDDNYDIYKIRSDGKGEEIRLTTAEALDDGSEYSPDGKHIYFNSARTGKMQLWRMNADGTEQVQISDDEYNNWFPHVSPDGKTIAYLAFMPEIEASDHPWYKHVYLMVMPVDGGEPRVLANLYGGQGTINVPSWSPDSKRLAFVSNTVLHKPYSKLGKFNVEKDLFLPQFDSKTDVDDIHSVAAVGTLLADSRFSDVRYHAVAGAYGIQEGLYVPANHLFDMAFGKNWSDAHDDRDKALDEVTQLVFHTLDNGGAVWIADAGQSDFSAAMVRRVKINRPDVDTKTRIHLVQHSEWNQDVTTPADLEFVRKHTAYHKIADGNVLGNGTPGFKTPSDELWAKAIQGTNTGRFWEEARRIGNKYNGVDGRYLNEDIKAGGMDFSDTSESCWIFGCSDLYDSGEFFDEFTH